MTGIFRHRKASLVSEKKIEPLLRPNFSLNALLNPDDYKFTNLYRVTEILEVVRTLLNYDINSITESSTQFKITVMNKHYRVPNSVIGLIGQ